MTKIFLAAATCGLLLAATPSGATNTAAATVSELYASYGQGCNHPNASGLNDELATRLFDKDLAKSYREAGWIDADFFIAGQDWCIVAPVSVVTISQNQSKAKVLATVKLDDAFGHGTPRYRTLKIRFDLVRAADRWRISNAFEGGQSVKDDWRPR